MSKNRELSQFGSFVYITDSTKSIGIATEATPYVGIGTDNATTKLHVVGDVKIVGLLTASSFVKEGNSGGFLKADGTEDTTSYSPGVLTSGTFTASPGISTDIDSFSISPNDSKYVEYTLYFENSNKIQMQKVLVMNNGTTAYSQEYAIMYEPSQIVSIGATIIGTTCKLVAIPEVSVSGLTTFKSLRTKI